jgi:two-component system response regulator
MGCALRYHCGTGRITIAERRDIYVGPVRRHAPDCVFIIREEERNHLSMNEYDILLVEDNRHDVEMILDIFRELNISSTIFPVKDGKEAVDLFFGANGQFLNNSASLPQLVLLDLKLPKISGLEVLKCLKSNDRTKQIPVVVFTSSNELNDRRERYQLGANSYIVKPLDADKFKEHIGSIVTYWLMMNKTAFKCN